MHGCEFSPELRISSVHIDNAAAAHDATRHLIEQGHRRIGLVTGPMASPLSQDRLAGSQQAAAAGPEVTVLVKNGDFTIESGEQCTTTLIQDGATAIFCFSDEMAMGAFRAISRAGLACPDDISVIGFDNIRFAAFTQPALSTVHQPAVLIGRTAVELLLSRMSGEVQELENVILPYELMLRQSTGLHNPDKSSPPPG